MTMYLPNNADRPTGAEAGEFLDLPPMSETAEALHIGQDAESASTAATTPDSGSTNETRDGG